MPNFSFPPPCPQSLGAYSSRMTEHQECSEVQCRYKSSLSLPWYQRYRGGGRRLCKIPYGGSNTVSKVFCSFKSCRWYGPCNGLPFLLFSAADSHLFLCIWKLCSFFTAALCPTLTGSRQGLRLTYSISERHCRLERALGQSSNFCSASTKMFLFLIKELFPTACCWLALILINICSLQFPKQLAISNFITNKKIDATKKSILLPEKLCTKNIPFVLHPFTLAILGCICRYGAFVLLRSWFPSTSTPVQALSYIHFHVSLA